MPTQNMLLNVDQPSPRWFRKGMRITGLLSGPAFFGFVSIFNLSNNSVVVIAKIALFIPTVLEGFNAILSDGQEYAPEGTKQKLADITRKQIKEEGSGEKTNPH